MELIEIKSGYREPTAERTSAGYEIKRVFVAKNLDKTNDMEYRILNHEDLPQFGDSYPSNATIKVSRVLVEMPSESNFFQWEATVTYKTPVDDSGGGETEEGWQENLQWDTRSVSYEVPFELGYDSGNRKTIAVQSTTFEPIVGATTHITNTIVDISYNTKQFRPSWVKEFSQTLNSSNMSIVGINVGKGEAKLLSVSGGRRTDGTGASYYAVTCSVEIASDDFVRRLANVGFRRAKTAAKPTTAKDTVYILKNEVSDEQDETGLEKVNEPVKLNDNSQIIEDTSIVFLEFKEFRSASWRALNIPRND